MNKKYYFNIKIKFSLRKMDSVIIIRFKGESNFESKNIIRLNI